MKLQNEEGTTSVSLDNAAELIAQHGIPTTLDFRADRKKCDYFVTAKWPNGTQHTFTGFSWGYGGTGPNGLAQFFAMCKVKPFEIPLDKYGKSDSTLTL